ncbi:MAG: response regulator [Dehalococcoidia bacterium]|nr:response regulator [Dehalococcoidia bacterium]
MGKRVMIVDDEPSIRFTVQVILRRAGFEVLPVECGEKCIEELERGFKGVILMDVMMPGMNGWDTVKEINRRGLDEGNIISILTARQSPDVDSEELTEILLHYLAKPFEPQDLIATVQEYCECIERAQELKSSQVLDVSEALIKS